MSETPIYTSASTVKSFWQDYHIFEDRVVFDTLFGKLTIPFGQIERADVSGSNVRGLMKGGLQLKGFRPALKLDWANFVEHVVIDKSEGVRRVLFTPEDPTDFKRALDEALEKYREKQGATGARQVPSKTRWADRRRPRRLGSGRLITLTPWKPTI